MHAGDLDAELPLDPIPWGGGFNHDENGIRLAKD
jgi:hypothetical protein